MKLLPILGLLSALVAFGACRGEPVEGAADRPASTEKSAPIDPAAKTTTVSLDIEGMS
ncbi:MAG: hypothetical protein R3F20_09210 [Planctomycetota bacterium]